MMTATKENPDMNFFRNVKTASITKPTEIDGQWSSDLQIETEQFTAEVTVFFTGSDAAVDFQAEMHKQGIFIGDLRPNHLSMAIHRVKLITAHEGSNENTLVINLTKEDYTSESFVLYFAS